MEALKPTTYHGMSLFNVILPPPPPPQTQERTNIVVYTIVLDFYICRVKLGLGKGTMGPKKVFSDKEEKELVQFLQLALRSGNPLLKVEFKNQLQELVVLEDMEDRFAASLPSMHFNHK